MTGSGFSTKGRRHGYDFIFLGAGCASLSIVMRMIRSRKFAEKKILLIDKEPKTKNDRTWCFWEKQNGFFEEIVYKNWDQLSFLSNDFSSSMDISPYRYKMIRGIDFYDYCFAEIKSHSNIELFFGETSIRKELNKVTIQLNGEDLELGNSIVFNSFYTDDINTKGPGNAISLLQHFRGWLIETTAPVFNPAIATFMDFRVEQKNGTSFCYILPFTGNKALVEYTLFTESVLSEDEYDGELRSYLNEFLNLRDYTITGKESGIIPMTTRRFRFYKNSMYSIGTVGGQTKASSGYTYQFIQKQSERIVKCLTDNKPLSGLSSTPTRFLFYDKVLLDVLYNKRASGKDIFTTLFKKNEPQQVLRFLDNESSVTEELKIISTLPAMPFLKAAINQF